jgi:hypothetical protein
MLKMPETREVFFSVSQNVVMQGIMFRPAICYPLKPQVRAVVERMADKGLAKIYPEKVRFVSGTAYPVKKPDAVPSTPSSVSSPKPKAAGAVKKAPAPEGKRGRKTGRSGFVTQTRKEDREFD